jgi:hypothetical protein
MKAIIEFVKKRLWVIPVGVGFFLRLIGLTASAIWHDEGYTMWLLRFDPVGIIERTARDVHPPGYYLLSKVWVSILGTSEFSIRFFSLIFSVGIIYLVYKIVESIKNKEAAFWASIFVALSPFMIRFGQEARMYGVVAFFTTLATWFLIKFIKENKAKTLVWYALSMTMAVYTQYYGFFVVITHWLILSLYTPGFWTLKWRDSIKNRLAGFNPWWWVANFSIVLLYLPWFPVAYKQVTRVSGSYWIKPEWITVKTIPSNILQFINYSHLDGIVNSVSFGNLIYWITIVLLIGISLYPLLDRKFRKKGVALALFGFLPMILVFVLSKLKTPVYQDRYFPFSAIGIFALWGVAIAMIKNKYLKYGLLAILLGFFTWGYVNLKIDVNHGMKRLYKTAIQNSQPGDRYYSGELYTFLDGSYYFGYGNIKFISAPVDGYGESSLFYKEQDQYLVSPESVKSSTGRLWVVGKTGQKDYFDKSMWPGWEATTYYQENKDNGLKLVLFTKAE